MDGALGAGECAVRGGEATDDEVAPRPDSDEVGVPWAGLPGPRTVLDRRDGVDSVAALAALSKRVHASLDAFSTRLTFSFERLKRLTRPASWSSSCWIAEALSGTS